MNLTDLTEDERLAFVGLVQQIVGLDEHKSAEEMEEFRAIAAEMGKVEFDDAFRKALAKFANRDQVIAFARTIERQGAREIIHTCLTDLASADFVSEPERALLREIAGIWGLKVR
jgi:uncharacterized tellurite resistance protein B-like protein